MILGIIGGIIYFIPPSSQDVIPQTCQFQTTNSQYNSYSCPTTASGCSVKVTLQCDTKVTEPKVIARTDDSYYKTGWLAYDRGNGLESWVYDSLVTRSVSGTQFDIPYGRKAIFYTESPSQGEKLYVLAPEEGGSDKYYRYRQSSGADTSPTIKYNCQNQEYCFGTNNIYQCTQQVTGSVSRTVSYSGSQAGSKTDSFTLTKGQTISWNGKIDYTETTTMQSECTKNVKATSPNTYYVCILNQYGCGKIDRTTEKSCGTQVFNELTGSCTPLTTCKASNNQVLNVGEATCINPLTLETCTSPSATENPKIVTTKAVSPQICRDGVIADAYKVTINLNKQVLSTSDELNIDFSLSETSNNKNIDVTAQILKGSSVIATKTQQTGDNFYNEGTTSFSFDAPAIGYYTLRITFNHQDGNYKKEYSIQVTDSLAVSLKADNPIQFDTNPIEVTLTAYKSGSLKDLKDYSLDATFNGQTVYVQTKEHPSLGTYLLKYNLKGDGILRIRAKGQDETGLWTDYTEYYEVTVKKSTILFTTNFVTDVCTGSHTNKFETKDSSGNYVDTTNIVIIQKPLGGSDTLTASGSNGKYEFNYNFADGGLYIAKITSTNSQLGSSQLNNGGGQTINILAGGSCGNGGTGGNGGTDWTMYLIVGIFVLAIIMFVYFVFIRKRK